MKIFQISGWICLEVNELVYKVKLSGGYWIFETRGRCV